MGTQANVVYIPIDDPNDVAWRDALMWVSPMRLLFVHEEKAEQMPALFSPVANRFERRVSSNMFSKLGRGLRTSFRLSIHSKGGLFVAEPELER